MEMKIKPSDLKAQAQKMINQDQMPALDQVLSAVAEARGKYKSQIESARKENEAGKKGLRE